MIWSFVAFTIFTMACAVAPTWPAFLIFRLLSGFMASSAIAIVGGLYADVFDNPATRGRAIAVFMTVRSSCAQFDHPRLIAIAIALDYSRWP